MREMMNDVVVVVHSYGGLPASEVLKGLEKKKQEEKGLKGGVTRMVFIMAFVAPERGDTSKMMPYQKLDLEAGTSVVLPEDVKRVFFNDLPEPEASEWAAQVRLASSGASSLTLSGGTFLPLLLFARKTSRYPLLWRK